MPECMLCPRRCQVLRKKDTGVCGVKDKIRVARIGLHNWEEPCISYGKGSGTVFFSGCNLKCVFCQNNEISHGAAGKDISEETLAKEILILQDKGAVNINLVTPTHFADKIAKTLEIVRPQLKVPVIYNCGGYESLETLKMLSGLVDVYLPDMKYKSPEYSRKYSACPDYFEKASESLDFMIKDAGYPEFDENEHIKRGVIVRHLVIPSLYKDSISILEYLASKYDVKKLGISIMSQYFPTENCKRFPEINRHLTTLEYSKVVSKAKELGFEIGYIQDKSSANDKYVPCFDY